MNLFDQFLATQGRMAANDAATLENKLTLAKIGQMERAQKTQDETMAIYRQGAQEQAQPKVMLANLSDLGEAPDATMESQGMRAKPEVAPPKLPSPSEAIMSAATNADAMGKKFQSVNPAESARLFKERDDLYLKAAPMLKEERLAKIEESNQVNQYMGAVKDEDSFNGVMAMMQRTHPEIAKAWANLKLPNGVAAFPRNLDGSFAFTPQTAKIVESVANASMKRAEQLKAENDLSDNKRAELELQRKREADKNTERHQREMEAQGREGIGIKKELVAKKPSISEPGLTPEAIQAEAEAYNTGKPMPARIDPITRLAIINKATELANASGNTADRPAKQAEFKANSATLTQITKDLAAITPYKEMLDTNIAVAKTLAAKAISTDSRFANKSINWLKTNATDNPDVAEYLAQMHFVSTESARVLTNPRLVGQLTDTAIRDMKDVVDGHMPLNAANRVLDRIASDGTNRVKAMEDQHAKIIKKMSGNNTATIPTIKDDAGYSALKSGQQFIAPDGTKRTKP